MIASTIICILIKNIKTEPIAILMITNTTFLFIFPNQSYGINLIDLNDFKMRIVKLLRIINGTNTDDIITPAIFPYIIDRKSATKIFDFLICVFLIALKQEALNKIYNIDTSEIDTQPAISRPVLLSSFYLPVFQHQTTHYKTKE
eukprot:GHVP01061073.1.p3 GENE.GHVP01061073.1~~GHVP01061073.1.p3  ORF type:complete len:145 (+),score=14.27 GHVP01061073.1:333-767(+)